VAFNSAGVLFEADWGTGNIYEFTTTGVKSTFASGMVHPEELAFQPVPVLARIGTNGTFQLSVTMPSPYFRTILQGSSNLVNWVNICTNTPPFTYTNFMAATSPSFFYRAVLAQ
jgi:hypothetical protein